MAETNTGTFDAEYVADRETEVALLDWCARRRHAVVPGAVFLLGAELIVLTDVVVLWRDQRHTLAFLAAMALQIVGFAVAVVARDPDRVPPFAYPHAELITLGLLAASFVVTFEHQSAPLALVLMAGVLALLAVLVVRCWPGFAFLRDRIPDYGRAVHIHADADAIEITVRPRPAARRVPWKSVRYAGSDGRTLFVAAGIEPFVVPRRAFPSSAAWEAFGATVSERVTSRTHGRRARGGPGTARAPRPVSRGGRSRASSR